MLQNKSINDWMKEVRNNSFNHMKNIAEKLLNPSNFHLSREAKKRLVWLYILYYKQDGNISKTARKIGISRQWLSHLKSMFEFHNKDPRSLELKSKNPNHSLNRKRISKETEELILKIRKDSLNTWGKMKISKHLKNEYGIIVNHNTVNKYLHKHKKIDPKISLKNTKAFKERRQRELLEDVVLKVKFRPPSRIKDYAPGALTEKDMKYVLKMGTSGTSKKDFWYQHGIIDSFTRIKVTGLTEGMSSKEALEEYEKIKERLPFSIASMNTDNGGENEKDFSERLQKDEVFHFYSNSGTPTHNPRIERSFLTDDLEFYQKGGLCRDFEEQKKKIIERDDFYNWKRPHQALGYLTPMKFYHLWKENPKEAFRITNKWQEELRKQRVRQARSRKMKKEEQINALMNFIDAKLNKNKGLKKAKLQLINCQLCSVA